jgi:hypothetical protein
MKVNLTRLLEIPARIRYIKEIDENGTGALMEITNQGTSSDRAYSFELEDVKDG